MTYETWKLAIVFLAVYARNLEYLVEASDPVTDAIHNLQRDLPMNATLTSNIPDPIYFKFGSAYNITQAAMVFPDNYTQLITALTICHNYKVPVAIRSGEGHSYIGQSSVNNGIVLSLQRLKNLDVEMVDGDYIVQMGGGLSLIDVYTKLAYHDPPLGFAGGWFPSVGVGGFISGGGHGLLSSKYGIGVDRLVAADVVIFNKTTQIFQLVKATLTNEHADLMFAIRGGMGGNYGVVVNFYYKAFVAGTVLFSSGSVNESSVRGLATYVDRFMEFMQRNDSSEDFSAVLISPMPAPTYYFSTCTCNTTDNCSSCYTVTSAFRASTGINGSTGSLPSLKEMSLIEAQWASFHCHHLYPVEGIPGVPQGNLAMLITACLNITRQVLKQFNIEQTHNFFPSKIPLYGLEAMAAKLFNADCRSYGCFQYVLPYTHQMLEEPTDCLPDPGRKCTSFDHRQRGFSIEHGFLLGRNGDPSIVAMPWVRNLSEIVRSFSIGTKYQNYVESTMTRDEWIPRYFPRNGTYEKLQRVKCEYNSINMFSFAKISNFTIGMDGTDCVRPTGLC